MSWTTTLGGHSYTFTDLRELLAKATPLRSGDVLAGVAAASAAERVAAQTVLADVPLAHFLDEEMVLRRFCCPECQVQMAMELVKADEPLLTEFRFA